MKAIKVEMGDRSYQIHVQRGILDLVGQYVAELRLHGRCLLITNETVGAIYAHTVEESLAEEGFEVRTVVVEDSEKAKALSVVEQLYQEAYDFEIDRSSPVIALGGGVVGDLAGYVAATYMRGVPFFQVPTTLLAQVDSSIGGKTAVNYLVKNLIGTFYQPWAVIIDPATLDSLPKKEFRSGMAEVIKYGVIGNAELFSFLENNISEIQNLDPGSIEQIIYQSCTMKGQIVSQDELDYGFRTVLNLGHTFGHALEVAGRFEKIRHGEAVAVGMCLAAQVSELLGMLSREERFRIRALVAAFGLPCSCPENIVPRDLLEIMTRDKKNQSGRINVILPTAIGKVERVRFKQSELARICEKLTK